MWGVAGREGVQHADSDAGWRLARYDSRLGFGVRVRVRVRVNILEIL